MRRSIPDLTVGSAKPKLISSWVKRILPEMGSKIASVNISSFRFWNKFLSWIALLVFVPFGSCTDQTTQESNLDLPVLVNSTVACTRGTGRRMHNLRCENEDGTTGLLALERLFYGTTPTTSGCSISAPYENCCKQDPDNNCIFQSDFKLDDYTVKCSGKPKCAFYGQSVNSDRGDCDQSEFPLITSFSMIEYSCLSRGSLFNVCPKVENTTNGLKVYLDSNNEYDNEHLRSGDDCKCILYTTCGATITMNAMFVQMRRINSTECVEELTVGDLKDASTRKKYSCFDHTTKLGITNQILLTSTSNAMFLKLHIFERHNGKFFISAHSSDKANTVGIRCGPEVTASSLPSEYYCSEKDTPIFPEGNDTPPNTPPENVGKGDNNDLGQEGGDTGENKGSVIVKQEAEELHSGAIAGIVLAAVGILLVMSQVLYFLMKRHNKQARDVREEDLSQSGGSSSLPPAQQMVNPAFVHDPFDVYDNDEHLYDVVAGTVRGRNNVLYDTVIRPENGQYAAEPTPEKDVTDMDLDVAQVDEGQEADHVGHLVVIRDKHYMHEPPPPPYDRHDE